ncbi:triose-phosphate transporter family-domain-containing protein [Penicillium samsonianum]|uniref:triose-phosphate transporter family-domain-containing protein n=1 Tax=Penicillium samsonianum TaxID=1882272 RepID=UPI002547F5E6|nr:triose-phosphate transporter family-domain-containing protein [Penicillium samsonianum]KAJ6140225.1 triose-phosphate transporter family-domain-containing protein [Penicillium samsonianum]
MLLIGGASGLYRISFPIFATICVICAGVAISSYGEMNFNTFGVLIQIAGIGCEAVRLALSELLLSPSGRKMDPLTALYHFAPVCMAFCALAAPIVEGPNVFFDSLATWGALTLLWNCIVAFFLNLAAVVLIRHTSSLTLTVCGVPKAMLTIIVSIHFWGEDIQLVQLAGFLMASAGVIHYSQLDIRKRKIAEVGTEEVGGV